MGLINTTERSYYESDNYGSYQFVSIETIIAQFLIAYVGEEKILRKVDRSDIVFYAKRALQELSYDTFRVSKATEREVPLSLSIPLPQDYVGYTKIEWVDSGGVTRPIYPSNKANVTSKTIEAKKTQGLTVNGKVQFEVTNNDLSAPPTYAATNIIHINTADLLGITDLEGWVIENSQYPENTTVLSTSIDGAVTIAVLSDYSNHGISTVLNPPSGVISVYLNDTKVSATTSQFTTSSGGSIPLEEGNLGQRYGIDPSRNSNGTFFIDNATGLLHFDSTLAGKKIVLTYISDSLGKDGEMLVHKFAEEAVYKWILYAIASVRTNIPEYQINRFRKAKFAAVRTAKLRLSNLKSLEIQMTMEGKGKPIK
jgi:hypothetical protein